MPAWFVILAIAWPPLALAVALAIGRAIKLADQHEQASR